MIDYFLHLLILICIYVILVSSLNIAVGFSGILHLGHIALFGVGAYTSAILVFAGVPFLVSLLIAGLFTGLIGICLGVASGKLRGDYLSLATLAFGFVAHSIMMNWVMFTRGPLGLSGIPPAALFGITLQSPYAYAGFALFVAGCSVWFFHLLVSSPFGKLMEGLRDDELNLRVLGKNTYLVKIKVLFVSAFFSGIAGSMFAHYIGYIDPSSFVLGEMIFILTLVIAGGLASLRGSVVATIVLFMIPELLRFVSISGAVLGPVRQLFYCVVLLLVLYVRPSGIFGKVDLR